MKRFPCVLCLIALAAAVPAWADGVEEKVGADPNGWLDVVNPRGSLVIEGWDRREVEVMGDIGDEVERVDLDRRGDRVYVRVIANHRKDRADADLVIRAPAGNSLEIQTVSADVSIRGITGTQRVSSTSGEVMVVGLSKEGRFTSVSGDIEVRAEDGGAERLETKAVSGDVIVTGGVYEEIRANSTSGDVELTIEQAKRIRVDSTSGDVEVNTFAGEELDLRAESISGDVDIELQGPMPALSLSTMSGSIDQCMGLEVEREDRGPGESLRASGQSNGRLDANTMSGDIDVCVER